MDFVQVMKDWRRMCKAFTTDDDSCCDGCPVVDLHEHGCGAIFEMEDVTDWQKYADTIRAWAAEHPEPVYPTWEDFLESVGLGEFVSGTARLAWLRETHIPADIAEKLGLQPKEAV